MMLREVTSSILGWIEDGCVYTILFAANEPTDVSGGFRWCLCRVTAVGAEQSPRFQGCKPEMTP